MVVCNCRARIGGNLLSNRKSNIVETVCARETHAVCYTATANCPTHALRASAIDRLGQPTSCCYSAKWDGEMLRLISPGSVISCSSIVSPVVSRANCCYPLLSVTIFLIKYVLLNETIDVCIL